MKRRNTSINSCSRTTSDTDAMNLQRSSGAQDPYSSPKLPVLQDVPKHHHEHLQRTKTTKSCPEATTTPRIQQSHTTPMRGLRIVKIPWSVYHGHPSRTPEMNISTHTTTCCCVFQMHLDILCLMINESVHNKRTLKLERPTRWTSMKTTTSTGDRWMASIHVPKRYRYRSGERSNIFIEHLFILAKFP